MRGLLQKDDDEDVEQDDEDADHGLFRHLAGRTQSLGRFELLARRPSPSPGLALHQRAASEMRFHIQIMRGPEPRKQLAQPARRLRSKVAHWRSPSFSITTTKRIGLQCQISTKTRSLLYPDIKPEPGGEQLPWRKRMDLQHTTTIGTVLEHLIANGATDLGRVFGQLFELAMQIEREQHLKAGHRTPERQGQRLQADRHPRCYRSGAKDGRSRGQPVLSPVA